MSKHLLWCLAVICFCGCSMDDDDRCVDGYDYDPETKSCLLEVDVSCLWEQCAVGGTDCDGCEADFCVNNPLGDTDAPGFCTIENCEPKGCPRGYQCCDCSAVDWVVACFSDQYAALAGANGCDCS